MFQMSHFIKKLDWELYISNLCSILNQRDR